MIYFLPLFWRYGKDPKYLSISIKNGRLLLFEATGGELVMINSLYDQKFLAGQAWKFCPWPVTSEN